MSGRSREHSSDGVRVSAEITITKMMIKQNLEDFKMRKNIIITVIFTMLMTMTTAYATEVPKEAVPFYADNESVIIAESLISDILDEVEKGLGYGEATSRANNRIFKAVINNETNGYGYGVLADISRNAIFQYRDMYMHPEFFVKAEEELKVVLADIITAVANGSKDSKKAIEEAYERIYQTIDSSFDYEEQMQLDSCYRNIPSVSASYFTVVRKLILNAK